MNNSFTSWVRRTAGFAEVGGPCRVGRKWRWLVEKIGAPDKCWWCGVGLTTGGTERLADTAVTVDHVKPIAEGGADKWWNEKWSCFGCNQVRGQIQVAVGDQKKWIYDAYAVGRTLRPGFMRWIS